MPTPYGSHGGMAFSADELRVLRRALAIALQPAPVPAPHRPLGPQRAEEVRECLRLSEAVDEAVREGGRLRAFLLADLARYRSALPGAAPGYLERLDSAVATGYVPAPDDLCALRSLCAVPTGPAEAERRAELLRRCERLAERTVRSRLLALPGGRADPDGADSARRGQSARSVDSPRGAQSDDKDAGQPPKPKPTRPAPHPPPKPKPKPEPRPKTEPGQEPEPPAERPRRPIPTPAEVFPPRRRPPSTPPKPPAPPPEPPEERAAG